MDQYFTDELEFRPGKRKTFDLSMPITVPTEESIPVSVFVSGVDFPNGQSWIRRSDNVTRTPARPAR